TIRFPAVLAIERNEAIANLLDAERGSQGIAPPIHAQARAGHDQLVDVCRLKMLQQRRHVVKDAVFVKSLGFYEFLVVRETAHVHAQMDTRVESCKPPCFSCAHRHPEDTQTLGIDFGATGEIVKCAEFVKHHHSEKDLPVPQHELEGVLFAALSIGLVLALAEAPTVNGEGHQAFFNADRGISGLHIHTAQKLLLSETIHPGVPMDVKQPWGG